MEINKAVYSLLKTLDGDSKVEAEKAISNLEEVAKHLGELEKGERESTLLKEQLGDNKVADLITKAQFVDKNGGVDKIVEWKGNGEEHKAEIERLKDENLADQAANNQKTEELQERLDKANLFVSVAPKLDGFNGSEVIWEREADKFAMVGGNLTYDGKLFDKEGREALAAAYPYLVKSPDSGGAEHPGGDTPRPKGTKTYGKRY